MDIQRLSELTTSEKENFIERDAGIEAARKDVKEIIREVQAEGDSAVRRFAERFDGVDLDTIDITAETAEAYNRLDSELQSAIDTAVENVKEFHEQQVPDDWRKDFDGRMLGRRFRPIERVGVYVPGGTAAYPSSAIMGVVPAAVAGVDHIAVATPPAENLSDATLGAIHASGADQVYAIGGAQGVAALAYGTETVDSVQKIVGPGNRWVSAAKAEVRGDVEIDFVAGPSEVLVVADKTANPEYVAAELVTQAEHDPNASVVAIVTDEETAQAAASEVERQASSQPREETIRSALANDCSGILYAQSRDEATDFAEDYAAEHLYISTADDESVLSEIDSAGSVFLGAYTPVAAGDYASGTNHVLPTTGLAAVTGGLSVDEFIRPTTVQRLSEESLSDLRETIETLAEAEGLHAHADSVRKRFD